LIEFPALGQCFTDNQRRNCKENSEPPAEFDQKVSLFLAKLQIFRVVRSDSETMTHTQLQFHQNHRLPVPATIQAVRLPMRIDDFSERRRVNGAPIVEHIYSITIQG
jgi:hypothetical protein